MYGKIFESMYDGSLYGRWEAIVTFQQMIVLADDEGFIDVTPQALSARTSIPIEIIKNGIKILEASDQYSRTPDQEGKRIERISENRPWGWQIINYKYYRNLASREDKKRKDRERIAEKRNKNSVVAKCRKVSHPVADVAHTDTDTNTDIKDNSANAEKVYITKKKRKLSGKRLETFNIFWEAFNYKKGMSAAADSWLDIPSLTDDLVAIIVSAAKNTAMERSRIITKGGTPKMAQGWITEKRWEDEITTTENGGQKDERWENIARKIENGDL